MSTLTAIVGRFPFFWRRKNEALARRQSRSSAG